MARGASIADCLSERIPMKVETTPVRCEKVESAFLRYCRYVLETPKFDIILIIPEPHDEKSNDNIGIILKQIPEKNDMIIAGKVFIFCSYVDMRGPEGMLDEDFLEIYEEYLLIAEHYSHFLKLPFEGHGIRTLLEKGAREYLSLNQIESHFSVMKEICFGK